MFTEAISAAFSFECTVKRVALGRYRARQQAETTPLHQSARRDTPLADAHGTVSLRDFCPTLKCKPI